MSHAFLQDASFWRLLLDFDRDLATEVQHRGCAHCGATLHSARYPRKPRGIVRSVLGEDCDRRLSFCCARAGCRRRSTPPSVRFFHRRVYLGALVVLVTALSQGLTGWRRRQLHRTFGVSRRTLRRWQRWWRELFPVSAAWRNARGRFIPAVSPWHLPASLLERFGGADLGQTLIATLRFLAALSIDSEHAR